MHMFRVKIKAKELGLMVEQIDVKAETETEAMDWIKKQMIGWGVPSEKIQESVSLEKLELLLETR